MLFSYAVHPDYKPLVDDILKLSTVVVVVCVLSAINGMELSDLKMDCIQLYIYLLLAVCTYWLIIHKLIQIHVAESNE